MKEIRKPINRAFIIAEGKSEDFKNLERPKKLDWILKMADIVDGTKEPK